MVVQVQPILISDGEEFFEISAADLDAAREDGFYLPAERDCALVTDGDEIFEIPLDDLSDAETEGFRRLDASKSTTMLIPAAPIGARGVGLSFPAVRVSTGDLVEPVSPGNIQLQTDESTPERRDIWEVSLDTGEADFVTDVAASTAIACEEFVNEDAEYRADLERQIEDAQGLKRLKLILLLHAPTPTEVDQFSRTYGLSTLVHMVALLVLSLIIFQTPEMQDGGAIISSLISEDEQVQPDDETPEIEIEKITEATERVTETADAVGEIQDTVGLPSSDLVSALSPSDLGGGLKGVGDAAGDAIKAPVSFFGAKTVASRFVFVIDNSNSMTKGRFETALNELAKTLDSLSREQSYYILFYSDTAYGLFHPYTVSDLIPATKKNKLATLNWLLTVELCLRTDAAEALQKALVLEPDVIFVLGDGAFTDTKAVRNVIAGRSEKQQKIKINALGMEVNASAAKNFTFLTQQSGGTYNDVGVHPVGAEIARRAPRPKNNQRGPVWGIKLPAK